MLGGCNWGERDHQNLLLLLQVSIHLLAALSCLFWLSGLPHYMVRANYCRRFSAGWMFRSRENGMSIVIGLAYVAARRNCEEEAGALWTVHWQSVHLLTAGEVLWMVMGTGLESRGALLGWWVRFVCGLLWFDACLVSRDEDKSTWFDLLPANQHWWNRNLNFTNFYLPKSATTLHYLNFSLNHLPEAATLLQR